MIKVLLVVHHPSEAHLLAYQFSEDPELTVIGISPDGKMALTDIPRLSPDLVIMDIKMPRMGGIEATTIIMENFPLPIILLQDYLDHEKDKTIKKAMEAGAIFVAKKPHCIDHLDMREEIQDLIRTVKAMSEVKVHHRVSSYPFLVNSSPQKRLKVSSKDFEILAIGGSTGGPAVINTILAGLTEDFILPVLIVQHMSPGFIEGLATWISNTTGFPAVVARHGEQLLPRHAYFAPDNFHLVLESKNRIALSKSEPVNRIRPSVSRLFASVGQTMSNRSIGVLLTGMGDDGARELRLMRDYGATTIAQNEESCVVYGMPGEAVKLDAAEYILPPSEITKLLLKLCTKNDSNLQTQKRSAENDNELNRPRINEFFNRR